MGLHLFFLPNFPGATFIPDSSLVSRTGHLHFTQTRFKIHVPCDISAHANLWVCLHCDDVVSICKWNLLLLFF